MSLFDTQPIKRGCGPIHVNRFRISFRAPALGPAATPGSGLFDLVPKVMDPDTARAERDRGHPWNGRETLYFHGRAKIRAFDVPFLPLPIGPFGSTVTFPVPPALRHLELPPFHTDHVGVVQADGTGFTVQTLTRHFPRPEDAQMMAVAEATIQAVVMGEVAAGPVGLVLALGTEVVAQALLIHAMEVNRHHFLAGRRSFRMIRPAAGSDVWTFETAAVERFALPEFQMVTDYLLGGDKAALGPVWKQMCRKLAHLFGPVVPGQAGNGWQEEAGVLYLQQDLSGLGAVRDAIAPFATLHPALFAPG